MLLAVAHKRMQANQLELFPETKPSLRVSILHCGGKMDETRTKFCEAIPASRSASSKEVKRSLCLPTPLVKNSFFGTMLFPNFDVSSVSLKWAGFLDVPA